MLFATLGAPCQQDRNERSRRGGQQPIYPQAGRQGAAQDPLPPVRSTISYARAVTRLSSLSTFCLADSSAAASASGATRIGSPATIPMRLKGRLTAERSQLSSSIRRLEAIATA